MPNQAWDRDYAIKCTEYVLRKWPDWLLELQQEDYIASECYRAPMANPLWLLVLICAINYQPRGMFQKVPIPLYQA